MRHIIYIIGVVLALTACSSVDCPLNNVVYAKYKLMGDVTKLSDVLTITTVRADGTDTILLNQQQNADSFELPMSFGQTVDELCLTRDRQDGSEVRRDTIWIEKTNEPHFESVDCGVNYFHTITGVRHTSHTIDSVTINKRNVNYDASVSHLYIYFRKESY